MLPLADTEKLIREKDEEVSKHISFPLISSLDPIPASPGPIACNLASHSCAACKKCWRRCKLRCSRARPRASSQTHCETLTAACLLTANLRSHPCSKLPSVQSGDPEGRPALVFETGPSNPEVCSPTQIYLPCCSERTALRLLKARST